MVTLRWFPPSWIELASRRARVYIDPAYLKRHYANHPSRIEYSSWPVPIDGLPEPLEPADLILVTHAHKDHCKLVTVRRLITAGTKVYGPASCRTELGDVLHEVRPGDKFTHRGVAVEVVPAHNTPEGRSTRKQHPPGRDVGFVVAVDGVSVYHAGDTDLLPHMARLGEIDVACLPVGGRFTMDAGEAVEAVHAIGPKWAIPMHFMDRDPGEFATELHRSGSSARAARLGIGEPLELA